MKQMTAEHGYDKNEKSHIACYPQQWSYEYEQQRQATANQHYEKMFGHFNSLSDCLNYSGS